MHSIALLVKMCASVVVIVVVVFVAPRTDVDALFNLSPSFVSLFLAILDFLSYAAISFAF